MRRVAQSAWRGCDRRSGADEREREREKKKKSLLNFPFSDTDNHDTDTPRLEKVLIPPPGD